MKCLKYNVGVHTPLDAYIHMFYIDIDCAAFLVINWVIQTLCVFVKLMEYLVKDVDLLTSAAVHFIPKSTVNIGGFNPLKTKRRLLYLKTQFVPRSKHFSSRL